MKIELRSDTLTLPTGEMRRAMYEAEVGDDVYEEDPTANRLEELVAQMLGQEAALFASSGTMGNLVAVLSHTRPGDEVLVGSESHILWYELGGTATLGGVILRTIPNDREGRMAPGAIAEAVHPGDILYPPTTLLCLENTHNRCGGAVLTPRYTAAAAQVAREKGLKVHLDGARIFNAAVALGVSVAELAKPADSVCICLSKGLSAPVGSVLCGSAEFIKRARRWRRLLGGGMRQVGVIAAAGIVAVQTMVPRLAEDHENARRLAQGLANIPGIDIDLERVQTNIVLFDLTVAIPAAEFVRQMNVRGIGMLALSQRGIRAVTNRMVTAADIDEVIKQVAALMSERG